MPNNGPTPVLNSIAVTKHSKIKCDAVKAKFNIKTRKHAKGGSGNIESHHICQDKAMTGLISKYSGHAILLTKSVHRRINARQIARNCPGPGPTTFSELQISAREDLRTVLKGKKHNGNTMTDAEAKIAADCLVEESVRATQANRKKKKRKYLTQNSRVKKVKGCFARGTLIWLNNRVKVPVESLQPGDIIETNEGTRTVVLTDTCVTSLIEVEIEHSWVRMAPFHRVLLTNGRFLRSDLLKVGHQIDTEHGPEQIQNIRFIEFTKEVVSFTLEAPGACRIGACGLQVNVPHSDHRVSMTVNIVPIASEAESCLN